MEQQQEPSANATLNLNPNSNTNPNNIITNSGNNNNNNNANSNLSTIPSSAPGSPRRRRATAIDLDAALYLQSQASYVQEPNRSSPAASRGTPVSAGATSNTSGGCAQPSAGHQRQPVPVPFVGSFDYMPLSSDHLLSSSGNNNSSINNNNYYYSNTANISVDYIDCVSNYDLASSAEAAAGTANRVAMMRNIPCRKHLRFHRNRIEPATTSRSDAELHQQASSSQQQAGPGAGANHLEQVNNPILDTNTTGQLGRDGASMTVISSTDDTTTTTSFSGGTNSFNHDHPLLARAGPQPGTTTSQSVLYPISVSEVKKRTYFIGSVSQDSLLGQEELYRYFPTGRVSIFVCTWNQNRKRAPINLNDLLLPDQINYMPDIYAIGIQEAFSSQTDYLREWEIELQTTLGPNHVLLHSCSLGVLHLSLFVRRDLIWFCSMPEESLYNSRSMPTNMIKTKGAISIAFRFFGTSFMFTNCHFPAHENKLKDRIDEYQRIINSIDLPKNLKLLKPRYLSNDSTGRFDCVFFMGDLNFRLEQRTFDETIHILEDIFQQKEPSYEALTQNDELLKVMESQQAFHGFDESQIKFPPTYKFLAQTNKYDRQTKRVPSYTDRILFRSKRQRHIQCLIYDWLPQLLSSDHKPVYCLFDVLVRPGHEQNMVASLNAGLFQRTVYLEALKRRSEDPDGMRENGAGGNLICSIS